MDVTLTRPAAARPMPRDGDLVVAEEPDTPGRYAIRQVPGSPQVSWSSARAAIEMAGALARSHGVDVWTTQDGAPVRILCHRGLAARLQGPRTAAGAA